MKRTHLPRDNPLAEHASESLAVARALPSALVTKARADGSGACRESRIQVVWALNYRPASSSCAWQSLAVFFRAFSRARKHCVHLTARLLLPEEGRASAAIPARTWQERASNFQRSRKHLHLMVMMISHCEIFPLSLSLSRPLCSLPVSILPPLLCESAMALAQECTRQKRILAEL